MKKSITLSAVTAVAALALAGQAFAFGGMGGGGGFGGMGGGGSFGAGSAAFSHQGSMSASHSRSRFSGDNPGRHLALGHQKGDHAPSSSPAAGTGTAGRSGGRTDRQGPTAATADN